MAKQKFGGLHTAEKLDRLAAYLRAFTTALKNQPFELAYLDAFAGTGEIQISERPLTLIEGAEAGEFVEGSVKRALSVDPPFHGRVPMSGVRAGTRLGPRRQAGPVMLQARPAG